MTTPPQDMVQVPALATIPNVDIVAAGTWNLGSGQATFTTEDLACAVEAAQCPSIGNPRLKLGHTPRPPGTEPVAGTWVGGEEPTVGRVANMSLTANGNKITGDLANMPGWLAAVCESAFPARSIEGSYDFVCQQGHTHPFVITHLALLGVSFPGVGVLSGLDGVAALYGVAASGPVGTGGRPWQVTATGGAMPPNVNAQAVTTEDVRRAYYASGVPMSMWITEMQMSPPQLIVADEANDKVFRVPFTIKGDAVTFNDPVEVTVEYADVKAHAKMRGTGAVLVWAGAEESRNVPDVVAWSAATQVKNLGDDPPKAALGKMFALPGDTKSDSKLPHHEADADSHTVGGPDLAGCQAAIGVINGAMGGLKDVSAGEAKTAYNHLAAHVRDLGGEPADYSGPEASAADPHNPDPAAGGPAKGDGDMKLTAEQEAALRTKLGLDADAEITAEAMMAALEGKPPVAASGRVPAGVIALDEEVYKDLERRAGLGEKAHSQLRRNERDQVIAEAVKRGKFPVASVERWERAWNEAPDATRDIIAGLKPGVVPVDDIGDPGGMGLEDDLASMDPDIRRLFPDWDQPQNAGR